MTQEEKLPIVTAEQALFQMQNTSIDIVRVRLVDCAEVEQKLPTQWKRHGAHDEDSAYFVREP